MVDDSNPVTPEQVGVYYDQMGPFFATLWGDHIHFGLWNGPDDHASPGVAARRMTDLVIGRTNVGAGQRFLDVGGGVGGPGIALAERSGASVVGVTVSQAQVAQANANAQAAGLGDRAQFQLADAMALPFADQSFDGAWAFESIIHMPSRAQVLREMARVTRPGGRVIVTDIIIRRPIPPADLQLFLASFTLRSMIAPADYPPLFAQVGLQLVETIDTTEQSAPILRELQCSFAAHADEMAAVYGAEFVGQMGAALPAIVQIYDDYLGYAVYVAEVPR